MIELKRWAAVPILSLALLLAAGAAATAQEAETAAPVEAAATADDGAGICLECHDKPAVTAILRTPHAQMADPRTPFANQQCQTCHGPSEAHIVNQSAPDIMFGRNSPTPAIKQNEVCLACHAGGARMNWAASEHSAGEVVCATCHNSHSTRDKVLAKTTQAEVCFTCHQEQRAQSLKRSRHPIKEGKVACADCHNPHGSFGPKQLVKNTINETCYQCHAEKRGPFLWEHAPVTDDCTNCHTPHGSSQPRLLKVRAPMLCQQCHAETQHPSTLYGGAQLVPTVSSRLIANSCMNCHSQIHGTNHPSGPRLTR